jgi:hypothetical protein
MELEAKNIRLGNLVLDPYGEVTEVAFGVLEYLYRYETAKKENIDVGACNYSELPLTRELIEELGYIINEDNGDEAFYTKDGFGVKWIDSDEFYFFYEDAKSEYLILREIYVAHELQNLHFDLTGKELTFKKK